MRTKAAVLREINRPLSIESLEIPDLKPGQVLVKVAACSLNFRDLGIVRGTSNSTDSHPEHVVLPPGRLGSMREIDEFSRKVFATHACRFTEDELLSGDAILLKELLGNLLDNAIRYTPDGGEVRIIWQATADGAEFAVEDTGIGIAPDVLPRLFAQAARTKSSELFLAISLLVVIVAAMVTAAAGLSPIAGALIALGAEVEIDHILPFSRTLDDTSA